MLNITRRDFHEADQSYSYELADGTKLQYRSWNGEGFLLGNLLYVPVKNPHPLDHYGEPDYYDVIGFVEKHLN